VSAASAERDYGIADPEALRKATALKDLVSEDLR